MTYSDTSTGIINTHTMWSRQKDLLKRAVLVTASAGAGKTAQLTQRYIHILNHSEDPEYFTCILAITFTNKAAKQMKERILSELITRAVENHDEKALKILESMLRNSRRFRVSTIDSFVRSLCLSSAAFLEFPPEFDVELNPDETINYALDLLLSDRSEVKSTEEVVDTCLEMGITLGLNPIPSLKRTISRLIVDSYSKVAKDTHYGNAVEIKKIQDALRDALKKLIQRYGQLKPEEKDNAEKLLQYLQNASARQLINEKAFKPLQRRSKSKPRMIIRKNDGELQQLYAEVTHVQRDFVDIYYSNLSGVFSKFVKKTLYLSHKHLKRKGRVLLADLYLQLLEHLEKDEVPTLFFYLGEKLEHYLIDEFQDTNPEQWAVLQPLIETAISQNARASFFAVGDRKQAIYRFRGGDSRIFDHVIRECFQSERIHHDTNSLRTNYRSLPAILNFVADVFQPTNLTTGLREVLLSQNREKPLLEEVIEEVQKLWAFDTTVKQKPAEKNEKAEGFVKVEDIENAEDNLDEVVKETLLKRVHELLARNWALADISILVRDNQQVQKVTGWLKDHGISVASEITWDVRTHATMREIIALLRFLNHPPDDTSFAGFIMGELFLSLAGLRREEVEAFLQEHRLEKKSDGKHLYQAFQNKFPEEWETHIAPFFRMVGFRTPYELLVALAKHYREFFEKRPEDGVFLYHLLETAAEAEANGNTGMDDFMRWLDSAPQETFLLKLPDYGDAVQVLTVHKAKGLAFPVVIYPFGYITPRALRLPEVFVSDEGHIIMGLSRESAAKGLKMKTLVIKEIASNLIDELNLLYVAFTRAQYELHVFCLKPKHSPWIPLPLPKNLRNLTYGVESSSCVTKTVSPGEAGELVIAPVPFAGEGLRRLVRRRGDVTIDIEERRRLQRGRLIHRALAYVEVVPEHAWEEIIHQAVEKAAFQEKLHELSREIARELITFFQEPENRALIQGTPVMVEADLCDSEGNIYRPDRVQERDGIMEVIEFKTGEHPSEEHAEQVKSYIHLLQSIFQEARFRGYVAYIDLQQVETIPWQN